VARAEKALPLRRIEQLAQRGEEAAYIKDTARL
jgi:hypothetical protein